MTEQPDIEPAKLDVKAVSRITGATEYAIREAVRLGRLRATDFSPVFQGRGRRQLRFTQADVTAWFADCQVRVDIPPPVEPTEAPTRGRPTKGTPKVSTSSLGDWRK
jgi:hypothetical protein